MTNRVNSRTRAYQVATVVTFCLTALCFEWQIFLVPIFAIATLVLSRFAIRHGIDRFGMNVLSVVAFVLALPVLVVLPWVLTGLPHLSVGGVSLSR